MDSGRKKPLSLAWMLFGLILVGCLDEEDQCDLNSCSKVQFEISTQIIGHPTQIVMYIDTLDTGQLYVQAQIKATAQLQKGTASATKCDRCESLFRNSSLTFDQPILAGADTIPPATNLLGEGVISKIGSGSYAAIIFNRDVRFRKGENKIVFACDLLLNGSKKIGSVNLKKTLYVGDRSAW